MSTTTAPATFTDDEFDALVGSGAFDQMGRVELRDGTLVRVSPQHAPHGRAKQWLAFQLAIAGRALELEAATETSVRFGGGFTPLPDVLLWRPSDTAGPIPADRVRLVAEIADTTLADDLGAKQRSYAAAGLAEYWVWDVGARVIHLMADPRDGEFRVRRVVRLGERLESLTIPEIAFETDGAP